MLFFIYIIFRHRYKSRHGFLQWPRGFLQTQNFQLMQFIESEQIRPVCNSFNNTCNKKPMANVKPIIPNVDNNKFNMIIFFLIQQYDYIFFTYLQILYSKTIYLL